jgi:hypothetical protein
MVAAEHVLLVVSLLGVVAGSFLRHDAYPAHDLVGKAAEAVGWLGTLLSFALAQQHAADTEVACRVYHHCTTPTARAALAGWIGPAFTDAALAAAASAVGWLVATATRRRPEKPDVT